jgi:hypothetical protein
LEVAVEVHVESVPVGASVKVRIVLQDNRFVKELVCLNLTQANWEDFTNCLHNPPRIKQGRIVFTPVPKADLPPARAIELVYRVHSMEAVA